MSRGCGSRPHARRVTSGARRPTAAVRPFESRDDAGGRDCRLATLATGPRTLRRATVALRCDVARAREGEQTRGTHSCRVGWIPTHTPHRAVRCAPTHPNRGTFVLLACFPHSPRRHGRSRFSPSASREGGPTALLLGDHHGFKLGGGTDSCNDHLETRPLPLVLRSAAAARDASQCSLATRISHLGCGRCVESGESTAESVRRRSHAPVPSHARTSPTRVATARAHATSSSLKARCVSVPSTTAPSWPGMGTSSTPCASSGR